MLERLDFVKAYSYKPDSVSVTRGLFWSWLFTGSSRFLIIWYFLIPEVKHFLSLSNFGCTKLCPMRIALPCQCSAICTKVCGSDVWKMLVRTTLILYLSLDESVKSQRLPAPSELGDLHKHVRNWALNKAFLCNLISYRSSRAIWYFLILEVGETLLWLFVDQVFSRVDCLTLSELGNLHKHVQDWALKITFLYNPYLIVVNQSNIMPSIVNLVVLVSS